jgi:hypothetical protein
VVTRVTFFRSLLVCVALAIVAVACGSGEPSALGGHGSLSDFCDLLLAPPPTDAFRDPANEDARRKLDEYLAKAADLAPDEIRAEVITYRHSVNDYLDALQDNSAQATADAAQRAQEQAGDAVNRFVDDRCA